MIIFRYIRLSAFLFMLLYSKSIVRAQMSEKVFRTEYSIDNQKNNSMFIVVDNISFFRNIESPNLVMPGYTLPGFWLQTKAAYRPVSNIRLEGGIHSIWFWGTNSYPVTAYNALAVWNGEQSARSTHLYPFFRVQAALSKQVNLILGSLYGGANHQLIEPLYNSELNLTADPEAGIQLLYDAKYLHIDTWINWKTFIYKMDTKQEAFSFGISALINGNRPESALHVYAPIQILGQHFGGQIDVTNLPVQTVLNGAVGIGLNRNFRNGRIKKINMELDMLGYYQHTGNLWKIKRGYGIYSSVSVTIKDFHIKSTYWKCHDFISIEGDPLFGALSMSVQDAYFMHPEMYSIGGAYTHTFAKGYTLGVDFDLHLRPPSRINDPASGIYRVPSKTMYTFGVYLRANPSFLIKSF